MVDGKDWRGEIISAVANVFGKERECFMSELRLFVTDNAYVSEEKLVAHLEARIEGQTKQQLSAMEFLAAADRNSLLSEMKKIKDEAQKIIAEINQSKQIERELKSQSKKKFLRSIFYIDLKIKSI